MIFDGGGHEHEQVAFFHDRRSGLRAIIAIFSTALGPALGGTRFFPYPNEEAAVADVLNLSRAMAYKNAMAGLPHGGGKAVIIGDPTIDKNPELLRAYGRAVQSLGGRYVTAADVGTYVADMDVIAETCAYVTGRSQAIGGAGDSSVLTAFGVYQGMRAAAAFRWPDGGVSGRRIGVIGIGKVGRHLIELVIADGASVVATDVDPTAIEWARRTHPDVELLADAEAVSCAELDVLAPCALGGAIDDANVGTIRAQVICGGANNQLTHDRLDDRLQERGVLYCPDFVVNSGGVIQVADELDGFDFNRARAKTAQIYDTTLEVLELAASHIAEERRGRSRVERKAPPSARNGSGDVAQRRSQVIAGDRQQRDGDDAEGAQAGDVGGGCVGEDADRSAPNPVGLGEMNDLSDSGFEASEPTLVEVEGELLQVEGNGAHGGNSTEQCRSGKAMILDDVDRVL